MQDALAMKQVEVLLELHSKKMLDEFKRLREELSKVSSELAGIKKEVSGQGRPVSPVQSPPHQATQEFQPQKPAANRPIDRNGVAPEDVSIEKFFYVGGK